MQPLIISPRLFAQYVEAFALAVEVDYYTGQRRAPMNAAMAEATGVEPHLLVESMPLPVAPHAREAKPVSRRLLTCAIYQALGLA